MGVAALPMYTLNGEENADDVLCRLKGNRCESFTAKSMVPAVELAVYLGSAEAQLSHYKLRNVIPCNTEHFRGR